MVSFWRLSIVMNENNTPEIPIVQVLIHLLIKKIDKSWAVNEYKTAIKTVNKSTMYTNKTLPTCFSKLDEKWINAIELKTMWRIFAWTNLLTKLGWKKKKKKNRNIYK